MNINRLMAHKKLIILTALAGVCGFIVGQQSFFHQQPRSDHQSKKLMDNLPNSPLQDEETYVCPMHPEIIKDAPGLCDVCGMDLVSAEKLGYVEEIEELAPVIVPASAVLRTGKRAVVYIEIPDTERPTFEGQEIVLNL